MTIICFLSLKTISQSHLNVRLAYQSHYSNLVHLHLSRWPAEDQIRKEMWFKWLWMLCPSWCQTDWSGFFQKLVYWAFPTHLTLGFTENCLEMTKKTNGFTCWCEHHLNTTIYLPEGLLTRSCWLVKAYGTFCISPFINCTETALFT